MSVVHVTHFRVFGCARTSLCTGGGDRDASGFFCSVSWWRAS